VRDQMYCMSFSPMKEGVAKMLALLLFVSSEISNDDKV
jgi:hypothetical protein